MRLAVAAVGVLLAGPAVLAFFTGGHSAPSRAWAGVLAWLLAALGLALSGHGLLRTRAARLALGGLAGLAAWTLASAAWAPLPGDAWGDGQLTMLYLGALVAAATLLGERTRAVEPALALGALAVVLYALGDRLLPGLLEYDRSVSAQGRLEQPLTYWNALGALAATGLVLCASLSGELERGRLRVAAAAAAVPFGAALYLTVSRGALFACGAGLIALVVASRRREQIWATLTVAGAGMLAALAVSPFAGVTGYEGDAAAREREGLIVLVLLAVAAAAAAAFQHVIAAGERPGPLRLPRSAPWLGAAFVAGVFAVAVATGGEERASAPLATGGERFGTLTSNRYAYWDVAASAFAAHPIRGVGGGGWAVWWRRERDVPEIARDAHSLYVQTAAELGLVGLALLALWLAGVALAARSVLPGHAGLVAVVAVWAAHSALDWDFQMPAVTLPAVICMGALIVAPRSAAPRV
jgi:O-Antigen ligase